MTKVSVEEKFDIQDSPWVGIQAQGVNFHDYKKRIQAEVEKKKDNDELEQRRLGDINRAEDQIEPIDKLTEEEKDQLIYDDYLKKGLVNIKNLVLKNPVHRTDKENEFLILYLKHQYEIFFDIEKAAVEMFVQRLSFDVYKPGDVVAKTNQACQKLIMFIDGEVSAVSSLPALNDSGSSFNPQETLIRTFKPGQSIGEECFETEVYKL